MCNFKYFLGTALKCQVNEIYSSCGSSCLEECHNNEQDVCPAVCEKGCFCKPGFVRFNQKCISNDVCLSSPHEEECANCKTHEINTVNGCESVKMCGKIDQYWELICDCGKNECNICTQTCRDCPTGQVAVNNVCETKIICPSPEEYKIQCNEDQPCQQVCDETCNICEACPVGQIIGESGCVALSNCPPTKFLDLDCKPGADGCLRCTQTCRECPTCDPGEIVGQEGCEPKLYCGMSQVRHMDCDIEEDRCMKCTQTCEGCPIGNVAINGACEPTISCDNPSYPDIECMDGVCKQVCGLNCPEGEIPGCIIPCTENCDGSTCNGVDPLIPCTFQCICLSGQKRDPNRECVYTCPS